MRLTWLTDLHLDHVGPATVAKLWERVARRRPDAVAICGDTATAGTVLPALTEAQRRLGVPVHFVLGNHDFYGSCVAEVRAQARRLTQRGDGPLWLPAAGFVSLSSSTALVGHDGWADARSGDAVGSRITLSDWTAIADLWGPLEERLPLLAQLGDEAALHLEQVVPQALARHTRVVVLLHAPPFASCCRYFGLQSNAEWLPHLVCTAAGQALERLAAAHPDRHLQVLAGHTHGRARVRVRANLEVRVGSATYGRPGAQGTLVLD